ncbi:hypothetical protein DSM106972_038930 [Dulcicalothrix desertica PCC 7102]|uniref:Uncharacterized protein n=1 Tax=Dulcicalothrix desertica PCC 7102 TaxID=232991 RepID=A0A433VG57_9CYAN|nr:hypothetical protein [Dulcicalothrix desertica]RUT05072.1 hypothetical protein DSM106972_038930 [Dulcicalothrix desertica PCC 7102]TWH62613.1 hypothetical protein CAL7102_00107 [Dulcicalothrix desertica PCC 7102]
MSKTQLEELLSCLKALLEALDNPSDEDSDKDKPSGGSRGGASIEWKLINGYGPYPYLRFRHDGKYRSYYLKNLASDSK